MAQWSGQFSGRTHESKVKDLENSLRQALKALADSHEQDRPQKAKGVRHLSKKLLAARLKAVRARLSAITEPGKQKAVGENIEPLQERVKTLEKQGIGLIFREFDIPKDI